MRTVPTLPRSPFSAITKAFVAAFATLPLMAQAQEAAKLEAVTVTAKTSQGLPATMTAPSQSSLEAHSAQSLVGELQLRDYTSPIADYTQALNMTPGMFSTSPNGVGLGDAKITMRGATDSNMVFSFDGIPFNDTNGVSHHSWVFFPSQFIGGISVDRSPGRASTIGQATFSGSVDFRSRALEADPRTSVILSSGTWNTNLISVEHETCQFGADGKTNFLFAVQNMKSDGYQTYNAQERSAFQLKWEHENQGGSTLTLFASYLNLKTVALCLVKPDTGAQGSHVRLARESRYVANGCVRIEFVHGTGGGNSRAVVVLLVPIPVGVGFVIKFPAVTQIGLQTSVNKVSGNVIKVVTEVIGFGWIATKHSGVVAVVVA